MNELTMFDQGQKTYADVAALMHAFRSARLPDPEEEAFRQQMLRLCEEQIRKHLQLSGDVLRNCDEIQMLKQSTSGDDLKGQEQLINKCKEQLQAVGQLIAISNVGGSCSKSTAPMSKSLKDAKKNSERCIKKISEHIEKEKNKLKIKLIISERAQKPLSEISDADIAAYRKSVEDQLIEDWKSKKTSKRSKKNARRKAGKGKPPPVKRILPPSSPVASSSCSSSSSESSPADRRCAFLLTLFDKHTPLTELFRVTKRWKNASNADIKNFIDMDAEKICVKRYEHLSDGEINRQRARHYLPGVDNLLMNHEFKKMYTFPTTRGCGMFVTLHYGRSPAEQGIVYVGFSGSTIFHKYFESFAVANRHGHLTTDTADLGQSDEAQQAESVEDEEWVHTRPFKESIDAQGVITLQFPGELHFINIEPIRTDLLDSTLFS